jgi:ribose-phosphate pyrophosphokinase
MPEHVIVCRSLNQPNDKPIELLLCATTARELGAKRLTLVAPYLSYMRQTSPTIQRGVSQRIIGKLLAGLFDDVLTVDPHLHRISSLDQAIPIKTPSALPPLMKSGRFLSKRWIMPYCWGRMANRNNGSLISPTKSALTTPLPIKNGSATNRLK